MTLLYGGAKCVTRRLSQKRSRVVAPHPSDDQSCKRPSTSWPALARIEANGERIRERQVCYVVPSRCSMIERLLRHDGLIYVPLSGIFKPLSGITDTWQKRSREYSRHPGSRRTQESLESPTLTYAKRRRSWTSARATISAETSGKSGSTRTQSAASSSTGSGISGCSCTCSRRVIERISTIASCVASRRLPVTTATRRTPTSRGCWR